MTHILPRGFSPNGHMISSIQRPQEDSERQQSLSPHRSFFTVATKNDNRLIGKVTALHVTRLASSKEAIADRHLGLRSEPIHPFSLHIPKSQWTEMPMENWRRSYVRAHGSKIGNRITLGKATTCMSYFNEGGRTYEGTRPHK